MTTEEFFQAIAALSGLLFILASMLAMGLSLTMAQILQPLRNVAAAILVSVQNFDSNTVSFVLVAAVLLLLILLPAARRMGART